MIISRYTINVDNRSLHKEEKKMAREVASKIEELLSLRKMNQKDLAQMANITESAISHYIKGDRTPRGVNLIKIAKALGTTTDYLLEHDSVQDSENDMIVVKTLIARNAEKMTKDQKLELVGILLGGN